MKLGKSPRILLVNATILALILGSSWWGWNLLHPSAASSTATSAATVSVGDVTATVSASGTVTSPGDVGVSPTINGILTNVYVKVGQKVSQGQMLAQLDSSTQNISVTQSEASLLSAKVALGKLTKSRTADEQKQVDLQVAQSKASLETAQKNFDDQSASIALNVATYQGSVDAAKKSLDDAKVNTALSATTYLASIDAAKTSWDNAQKTLDNWLKINTMMSTEFCDSITVATANSVITSCGTFQGYMNSIQSAKTAYNNSLTSQSISLKKDAQSLASLEVSYQNAIASQSISLKKDAQTIQSLKNAIASAQLSYDLQQAGLAVAMQAANQNDLDTAAASIKTAEANLAQANKNLAATTINAPVGGEVASISATVGQSAGTQSSNTSGTVTGFIVLTNVSALRVQAGFSEADAAKIQVGQAATFTFEALPSVNANGVVAQISPLPTTTNNVVSYTVTFDLSKAVTGLKPGMTATATVTTGSATGVVKVTASAIRSTGNRSIVRVITTKDGKESIESRQVTIGLKGDGETEVQAGLKEGEKVALNATTTTSSSGFPVVGVPQGFGGLSGTGGGGFGGGGRGGGGGGGGGGGRG